MAEHKLKDLLAQIKSGKFKRTEPYVPKIWYNSVGDCIEFQTADDAFIADRIDDFLTIYRSNDDDETAIGFKLKDVKALMKKHGCNLNIVQAETLDKELMSVVSILTTAFEERPTIEKSERYSEALGALFGRKPAAVGEK